MAKLFSQAQFKATNSSEVEKTRVYNGKGTVEDPFIIEFVNNDAGNPMNWSTFRKWFITSIVTLSVFAVTFTSSAYSESYNEVIENFDISNEVFIVGVSLFVLGFAIGPALWAPLVRLAIMNIDWTNELTLRFSRSFPPQSCLVSFGSDRKQTS